MPDLHFTLILYSMSSSDVESEGIINPSFQRVSSVCCCLKVGPWSSRLHARLLATVISGPGKGSLYCDTSYWSRLWHGAGIFVILSTMQGFTVYFCTWLFVLYLADVKWQNKNIAEMFWVTRCLECHDTDWRIILVCLLLLFHKCNKASVIFRECF